MKQYHSILSVIFAFLVLFSSSSFMVGIHLCRGHVQDVALFGKATPCAMEKQVPPCHKHESKPCCEDEAIVHDGQDFQVSSSDVAFSPVPVFDIELPTILISEVIPSAPVARIQYHVYDPPLWSTDLTVSLQVFLI